MNTQSWILLIIIVAICVYILYSRHKKKKAMPGGCVDCPQASSGNRHESNNHGGGCPGCGV